jgi:hypothetical protein
MGRSGGTRVIIFESAIDAMHQPGGMVYDEMRDAAREVTFLAQLDAPKRTGQLAAGIRMASERRASRKKVGFYVRSDAPHSFWVHEGTRDQITPTTFPYMRLPAFPEMGARGTVSADVPQGGLRSGGAAVLDQQLAVRYGRSSQLGRTPAS